MTVETSQSLPAMTADNAPSGNVAFASSEYSSAYAAYKAFDQANGSNNRWSGTSATKDYVGRQVSTAIKVGAYAVTAYMDTYPTDWTLVGSNDGNNYTVLDTQKGQSFGNNGRNQYTIADANIGSYTYYAISITGFSGSSNASAITINELELLQVVTSSGGSSTGGGTSVGSSGGTSGSVAASTVNGLPTYSQSSIGWVRFNDACYVCQYSLDFTTYGQFVFNPTGAVPQSTVPGNVGASGVAIDNSNGANFVTVSIGQLYNEQVPPYTKATIILAGVTAPVIITSAKGQTVATFYQGIYPGTIATTNPLGASKAAIAVFLPPGLIIAFGGPAGNVPDGWLICDGSQISRTTYSGLFTALGTAYGQGDGASTFNLPDFRGRFMRGNDNSAGRDPGRTLGSTQAGHVAGHSHRLPFGYGPGTNFNIMYASNNSPYYGYVAGSANLGSVSMGQNSNTVQQALTDRVTDDLQGLVDNNSVMNQSVNFIIKT